MELFENMANMGHEQVVFFQCSTSGLRGIVAVHNTILGPALGGLRMWPYVNEEEALRDVLRHSMQRQRAAAALELVLLEPGRPLFEVRARGDRQRAVLG